MTRLPPELADYPSLFGDEPAPGVVRRLFRWSDDPAHAQPWRARLLVHVSDYGRVEVMTEFGATAEEAWDRICAHPFGPHVVAAVKAEFGREGDS